MSRAALLLIEEACATAEDQYAGGDTYSALVTLVDMTSDLIDALAPYAGSMAARTIIVMRNGNSLQVPTTVNTAADIAGLMNAGTPKVYTAVDVNDGRTHNIMVAEIQDVYEVP